MSLAKHFNPVWSDYCADPFVLKHNGFYYCYGTAGLNEQPQLQGRKFVLLKSNDLVNWELLGGALNAAPGNERAAHWAPEVAYRDGTFWMYYSASQSGDDGDQHLRLATSLLPDGPFEDQGAIFPDEDFCIDPSPFHDPVSDKWYLFFAKDFFEGRSGCGTAVVELADDMRTPIGSPVPVVVASHDWQIYERNRLHYGKIWEAWHTVEAPFIIYRNGRYYCCLSGGNWRETYGVNYATADHPLGPWTVQGEGASFLQGTKETHGPGHNSIVVSPDGKTDVCVYHAWNPEMTKRLLCVDEIDWTASGPRVTPTR